MAAFSRSSVPGLTLAIAALACMPIQAHTPWLVVNAQRNAELFFGEGLDERTRGLPDSIAGAPVYVLHASGEVVPLAMHPVANDGLVGLLADSIVDRRATLFASATYGLHQGSLLDYTAMHQGSEPAPSEDLGSAGLELYARVVPRSTRIDVEVQWSGQPLADASVSLFSSDGVRAGSGHTDSDGIISFSSGEVAQGLNGLLIGHTVSGEGTYEGEDYGAKSHYLSLTFDNPWSPSPVTARELRALARDRRAVWKDGFHGFTANIAVVSDGETREGSLTVHPDFTHTLELDCTELTRAWLERSLRSMIADRDPDAEVELEVEFADGDEGHAHGRLLVEESRTRFLRISDGVIREVREAAEGAVVETATLAIEATDNGKVLPKSTLVTRRDAEGGGVQSNQANTYDWTPVGSFQLPLQATTVEVGDSGARYVRVLTLSDHALTPPRRTVELQSVTLHKPLPEPLTSFGAAVLGDYLYVFSGHDGASHGFGADRLADHFRRIRFNDPQADWEELATQPPAQSTALVTDGTHIFRIGGLSFRNRGDDDETDFNSTTHFARYDVEADEWTKMPDLPEPRSSLDAAVVGRSVFVVGGWNLQGESSRDAPWHEDVLRFDLDDPEAGWHTLPGPGYLTRAASAAAHRGKLYLFGGIQQRGITRRVSIYDPQTGEWSEGPELKADSRAAGFATSSFATGGSLYVTGDSGIVYRLSEDGTDWSNAGRLMFPRMFHRLLPADDERLLALGGTSAIGGRTTMVESFPVGGIGTGPREVRWSVDFGGRAKHSQALVLDGSLLYAFGGNASRSAHDFSEAAFVDEAFVFDIARRSAEALPSMPRAVQSGAAIRLTRTSEHENLVVAGGMGFEDGAFGSFDSLYSFDPETEEWTELDARLPDARAMFRGAYYDDAAWFFGGSEAGHGRGLSPGILHWWGDESDVVALPGVAVPTPRRSFAGALVGDRYYMIGGLAAGTTIAEGMDVFSFPDRTWEQVPGPYVARVFPSAAVIGGKIYLFGGFTRTTSGFTAATELEVFDTETGEWEVLASELPGVATNMVMKSVGPRLLFYGIDEEVDGRANLILLDPEPMAAAPVVASMSFNSSGRDQTSEDAKQLMRKDQDRDGKLSRDELGSRLESLFADGDTDEDGVLSYNEVEAALRAQTEADDDA
ncbi:MAG: DUF3386 family protein [Planctomycetota bacterium]